MKNFINLSNHASANWAEAQLEEARKNGEIVDIPYPQIPTNISDDELLELIDETVKKVLTHNPAMVMCQGEMVSCCGIVSRLKTAGVPVVAAVSERNTVEKIEDGKTVKTVVFDFKGFRHYL